MKSHIILIAALAYSSIAAAQSKPATTQTKPAVAQSKPAAAPLFKNQLDSASYAFGASIANDLKQRGVNSLNLALVSKAMNDVFSGGEVNFNQEKSQEVIHGLLSAIERKKFEGAIAEAEKFLTENKKKPGIISLPSGLQYEVIQAGVGPKPVATDEVTVHYKGTLINGQQFDSSYTRGEPTSFTLNQVIPGWTEGLQQMSIGSKYRFFIPYALAYGERGAGKDVLPYSTLIFEVELIKIGK